MGVCEFFEIVVGCIILLLSCDAIHAMVWGWNELGESEMTVREEMDLLRRENTEMRKVLGQIAAMHGRDQWDEKNFGSYAVALANRARAMLTKLNDDDVETGEG